MKWVLPFKYVPVNIRLQAAATAAFWRVLSQDKSVPKVTGKNRNSFKLSYYYRSKIGGPKGKQGMMMVTFAPSHTFRSSRISFNPTGIIWNILGHWNLWCDTRHSWTMIWLWTKIEPKKNTVEVERTICNPSLKDATWQVEDSGGNQSNVYMWIPFFGVRNSNKK